MIISLRGNLIDHFNREAHLDSVCNSRIQFLSEMLSEPLSYNLSTYSLYSLNDLAALNVKIVSCVTDLVFVLLNATETLAQGEVVSNRVPPTSRGCPVEGKIVHNPLIDVLHW